MVSELLGDGRDGVDSSPDAVRADIEAVANSPALESDVTPVSSHLEAICDAAPTGLG